MSFASPVSRDGFHYNGDLHIEVGNLNRHKRASIPEITALLRPDLKKSKAIPTKDAVGHWYEAQLIHYGLPPSKDKARAKMRLLEALNNSTLVVPAGIKRLEESMRKEFDAAERKAKAAYKAGLTNAAEKPGSSKKRKQPDGTTVNVNINLGALGKGQFDAGPHSVSPIDAFTHHQQPSPLKKARESTAKALVQKETGTQAKSSPQKGKMVAANKPAATARKTMDEPPVEKSRFATKQTARRSGPLPKKEPIVKNEPVLKKAPAVKKEPAAKKEPMIKKEPRIKKETAIKSEPGIKNEPGTNPKPNLGLINGFYDISCPSLERDFPHDEDESHTLILCLDTPRVWGAYDLGQFSGIIHIPQRPYQPSSTPLSFHWRGRELGEGEMSFGDQCVGEIAFLGDGMIEGTMNVYGECEFWGQRRPGPTVSPRSAMSMRGEWEGYNESAYEAERTGRWG